MSNNSNIDIKYINRDFQSFLASLKDFAQAYFPNTNNDFSDASPATMFMEQVSAVGDVLSLYTDRSIQENFLEYSIQKDNILSLAYTMGYRPRVTSTAIVELDVYQRVPALITGGTASPDYNYALIIEKNAKINSKSNSSISFITQEPVNFAFSSSMDPTEVSVYSINSGTQQAEYFLLKKSVQAIAGVLKTQSNTFSSAVKFDEFTLNDTDVVEILNVVDSDGNTWYEVPYLAQSTVYEGIPNTTLNDPTMAVYNNVVPNLLKLRTVQRRFVTRFNSDNTLTLKFGAGVNSSPDEELLPNTDNVGMGMIDSISKLNTAYDPSNFLFTRQYGLAPANTTLTVTYITGGGVNTNVPSHDIVNIYEITKNSANSNPTALNAALFQFVSNTVVFDNTNAASGGGSGDTVDDIRLNAMAAYPTQLRVVTPDDYKVRAISMPSKFGTVAKTSFKRDSQGTGFIEGNPLGLSLYVLSLDSNGNLIQASPALKENLKNYLSQYKMENDGITIKDAFIINIGVSFSIVVLPNYNSQQVLASCLSNVRSMFDISLWDIGQAIPTADIYSQLLSVKGVQSVMDVSITNKQGTQNGYSKYGYDIKAAQKNNVIYPSLDPMIFEIKYPTTDIVGRVVTN